MLKAAGEHPNLGELRDSLAQKESEAVKAETKPAADASAEKPKGKAGEAPKRDASGRFQKAAAAAQSAPTSKGEAPAESKPEAPAAPKADAKPKPDSDTPEKREEWVRARNALKRDKYTDEEINAMPRGVAINIGLKRAQAQSEADRAFSKRKTANRSDDGRGEDSEPSERAATGKVSPKAGDNEPPGQPNDVVRAALERLTPAERKAIEQRLEESSAAKQHLEQSLAVRLVHTTRAELTKEFSAIAEEGAFQRVVAKMDDLDPEGKALGNPESFAELMRNAAYIVLGPETVAAMAERTRGAVDDDVDGQPETGGRRGGSKGLSRDEYETLVVEALKATGNDYTKARQWLADRTRGGS